MNCISCYNEIPTERLDAIPNTKVCVKCSDEQPYRAVINVSAKHKIVDVTPVKADSPLFDYLDEDKRR